MIGATWDEKRQIFERHFLLGRLSAGEIDTLLSHSRVAHHAAGEEIFAKGSPGHSMMVVLRGSVRIGSISLTGKEIVFNQINPGDVLGEIALLDGGERTGDATAVTDCELLVMSRRDLMPILERHPELCLLLIRVLCERLRRTSEQVEDLLFRQLESRIAKALLQLAGHRSGADVSRASLDLHLSQRELGNIVGSSRESVNKQLQIWHRAGVIEIGKNSIQIRDAAALEALI